MGRKKGSGISKGYDKTKAAGGYSAFFISVDRRKTWACPDKLDKDLG